MSSTLSNAEIAKARAFLSQTRDAFTQSFEHVSDAQWKFKPSAECWSIGEIVEHVVTVENRVLDNVVARLRDAPAPPSDRDVQQLDDRIITQGADRSTKFRAPVALAPSGAWSRQEATERFLSSRARIEAYLDSSDAHHRDHAFPHPVLGLLDGYQWVLLAAAHSARHAAQIAEWKASPNFPAS